MVQQAKPVLLPDVANAGQITEPRFRFTQDQLDTYGRFELQVLEGLLQRPARPIKRMSFARCGGADFIENWLDPEHCS